MYITTVGIWLIRTLGVYILGVVLGLGIAGVWIAILIDNLFRAVWLMYLFYNDRWVKLEKLKQVS